MNDQVERTIDPIPVQVEHTMLVAFVVGRELLMKKLRGELLMKGFPNCHAVARAYALAFEHLEVCDGTVPLWRNNDIFPVFHSWLRFKDYPKFGMDVAPLGALPFYSFPSLLYFDHHSLFIQMSLPAEFLAGATEAAQELGNIIAPIVLSCDQKK